MKKVFNLLFFVLCFSNNSNSQLIISQYIETNSGTIPKGIEIFNVSTSDIIFSASNKLEIYQGTNGAACTAIASATITSGTLQAGKVWVIGTSDLLSYATNNGTNLAGTTLYTFTFNGDDALQVYLGGILKDVFGTCGTDPGASWSANGVSTADQNIQLKTGICSATTSNWSDPSLRFETVNTTPSTDMSGFGNSPGCALPVSLISFSANKIVKNNSIIWSTASEQNNSGFNIERSTNGTDFENIGFVKSLSPSGNSSSRLDYSFTDYNPIGLKQYYRLKQTDFDGTSKYSAIVMVTREAPTELTLTKVYPNPSKESIYINAASPSRMNLQFLIADLNGRIVRKKQVFADIGNNGFDISVAELAPGTYILQAINAQNKIVASEKFIKQ
jgi:Secretion system C-terminal sorting domain